MSINLPNDDYLQILLGCLKNIFSLPLHLPGVFVSGFVDDYVQVYCHLLYEMPDDSCLTKM